VDFPSATEQQNWGSVNGSINCTYSASLTVLQTPSAPDPQYQF